MANIVDKTRHGVISIYHQCIPKDLASDLVATFKEYRNKGLDRDGVTGGGMNKNTKDSRDMNPHSQFGMDHPFRKLAQEAEDHVMDCIFDYYRDNPNMLYGLANFSLKSYKDLPRPEIILPKVVRFQHGQYQYYPARGESQGGGYPANHAETIVTPFRRTDSDYRALTWMMTLNDLPQSSTQDGYTVFTGQNIAVRPRAGQLVLFSPWLDCEHRGNRVSNTPKNIVTSWLTTDI